MSGAWRRAAWSGSVASVVCAAAMAAMGAWRRGDPVSPLNGPSQWLLGRRARRTRGLDVRHTLAGYAIHHLSSVLWAALFERARPRRPAPAALASAAIATGALAYVVDWHVVPKRLQPGFDPHVPRRAIPLAYVAFALGLVLATRTGRSPGRGRPGPR